MPNGLMDIDRYRTLHPLQNFACSNSVLAHDCVTNHRVLLTATELAALSSEQRKARQQALAQLRGLRHPAIPYRLGYAPFLVEVRACQNDGCHGAGCLIHGVLLVGGLGT